MRLPAVKIAFIGAGSARFSTRIITDLCLQPGLKGSAVALVEVVPGRLEAIFALAERLSQELDVGIHFSKVINRLEALENADFVIHCAQVGGYRWTELQRQMEARHGYPGGAGLDQIGQAALALEIAREMESACPHAWLIQLASPVFESCSLVLRETTVKCIGLRHDHQVLPEIVHTLGLNPTETVAEIAGFAGWAWLIRLQTMGEDAYPRLDAWIRAQGESHWKTCPADHPLSRTAVHLYRLLGALPLASGTRWPSWWYQDKADLAGLEGGADEEAAWQSHREALGAAVARVEQAAFDFSRPVSSVFPGNSSQDQVVPVINALSGGAAGLFQVSIPNGGPILADFPEDLAIECPAAVSELGVHPLAVAPITSRLKAGAMVPRWNQAERMIQALRSRERNDLLLYLLADHRTKSIDQAQELLDEWFSEPRNTTLAQSFLGRRFRRS